MVAKLTTPSDTKISNKQSAKNTPEMGESWQKSALKPDAAKTVENRIAQNKSPPKKRETPKKSIKIEKAKSAVSSPKKFEIDYSKVIEKGSVSPSGFMVMTYSPRDPDNTEHRKAAEAARMHNLDIEFAFWTGAAEKVSGWVKPVLDNSVGFALDALSQNHIEASKKAQNWIGLGKATIALAQKANSDKPKAAVKLAELIVVKPFMAVCDGINASVAKSAAGDDIGAARALGGAVAIVPAIAQVGIRAPKIVKGSVNIVKQLPKGIDGVGKKLPLLQKIKSRKKPAPKTGLLEHGPTFPIDRIGEGRGQGSLKKVYEITNTSENPQVVGIRYSGFKAIGNIEDEVAILRHLKKLGFPTINNPSTMMLQKKHGIKPNSNTERVMIMDAYPKGSKNLRAETYFSQSEWNNIANKNTLDSFKLIRKKFIENNIHVGDCQYEILPNGNVILTDPMGIGVGFFESDIKLIDKYIKMTVISLRKRKS